MVSLTHGLNRECIPVGFAGRQPLIREHFLIKLRFVFLVNREYLEGFNNHKIFTGCSKMYTFIFLDDLHHISKAVFAMNGFG
jgi:hypothetical protein